MSCWSGPVKEALVRWREPFASIWRRVRSPSSHPHQAGPTPKTFTVRWPPAQVSAVRHLLTAMDISAARA